MFREPSNPPSSVSSRQRPRVLHDLVWELYAAWPEWLYVETSTGPSLDVYHAVVTAIAREPAALTPRLLSQWTRALAACESSITLREQFSLYFPASKDDGHAHFVRRLREWLASLRSVEASSAAVLSVKEDASGLDFSNYYEVLSLPDDYYYNGESTADAALEQLSPSTKADTVDPEELFNAAFAEDLDMELASLFAELDELAESVYSAFLAVKHEKKTLVEAAAVAKVAIECAQTVIAALQVRYPSIKTAEDLATMISDRVPGLTTLWAKVADAWSPKPKTQRARDDGYQYVAGAVVVDLIWVASALMSFTSAIPADRNVALVLREGYFGETYNEERTPHYMVPDPFSVPPFLQQQLPLLYNLFVVMKTDKTHEDASFTGWFLHRMATYFATKKVTIELVFTCICWVRAVAALGRTVGLSILHRWDLQDRIVASVAHGEVGRVNASLHAKMVATQQQMASTDNFIRLARGNPLLAGLALLDNQFNYLHLGAEATLATSRLRGFAHLYTALRDRQLLPSIPFVEELLHVYEAMLFTPSRAAATHGAFLRTYLLSSNLTPAAVDALFQNRPPPSQATRIREFFHLHDLSRSVRLLVKKDYSVLPAQCASSWRSLLQGVSTMCGEELFTTRVLSRDMLKLSDGLTDLFNSLCDALGRRAHANQLLQDGMPGLTRQQSAIRVLEDVVVLHLLPALDCLALDGSMVVSEDARVYLAPHGLAGDAMALNGAAVRAKCQRAATLIKQFFQDKAKIERTYFTLPSTPAWATRAFGTADAIHGERLPTTARLFNHLMDMVEAATGPFSPAQLKEFKDHVMADPGVLCLGTNGSKLELATLFHHAVAGAIRDRRLVEWCIHMGALHHEAKYIRHGTKPGDLAGMGLPRDRLMNALAVHCAAASGYTELMRQVLEAGGLRDLNTVTYHTQESLAHLAVAHGQWETYTLLEALGADVTRPNAAGKHVYEVTTNREWRRRILASATLQRQQDAAAKGYRGREEEFKRQHDANAGQLRHAIEQQREQERRAAAASASASAASQKKKKKSSATASATASAMAPPTSLLASLSVEEQPSSSVATDANSSKSSLKALLALVSESNDATAATQAVKHIEDLNGSVQYFALPAANFPTAKAARQRAALDASEAVFQLYKYSRQLAPTANSTNTNSADANSSVGKLQQRASLSEFWVSLALAAAKILLSCDRQQQALEMLDVVERRLLKRQRRPRHFRKCVQLYAEARAAAEVSPLSPEAARAFEWYLTDCGIVEDDLLLRLDELQHCAMFTGMIISAGGSNERYWRFREAVEQQSHQRKQRAPALVEVVAFADYRLAIGSQSAGEAVDAVGRVFALCKEHGVKVDMTEMQLTLPQLSLLGFEFSADGIVREGP